VDHGFELPLGLLVEGHSLSRIEAHEALAQILRGEVDEVLISSFLTALTAKGETVDEMSGFVDAMIDAAETFQVPEGTIDIVGTGGDRLHSVNISTMAALTVAGCGVAVAKHGNRAASSSVGTADVLEALGVRLDVDGDTVARCVAEAGIGFCFAQRFHPGLRFLGPIRRRLGFPTVFNVLGPLANPAGVRRLMVGVANEAMVERMALVLQSRGVDHAILVHADDGLDELSLGSQCTLVEVRNDTVVTTRFDARARLGVRHDVSALRGGDVSHNARAVREFLDATPGAIFDTVTANAALALVVAGRAESFEEAVTSAQEAVRDGRAALALQRLVEMSNASS
jgi:anthranilate phosphoribosyltransferase